MAVKRLSAAERQSIIQGLLAGKSQGQIAREVGCSVSTVSRLAKAEGIDCNVAATKKATEVRDTFNAERRIALSDKAFRALERQLDEGGVGTHLGSISFKDWAVVYGVLTDKRRLEEGEATERHEHSDRFATQQQAIERGRDRLRLLAG